MACDKEVSKIPKIGLINNSKQFMVQNGQDSTYIRFSFEDGDGNLSSDTSDNILVRDGRTVQIIATHRIPPYTGSIGNIHRGEATIVVHSQCCIYPDSTSCNPSTIFPTRTMYYTIQVIDRAGNLSNKIESPTITLDCL